MVACTVSHNQPASSLANVNQSAPLAYPVRQVLGCYMTARLAHLVKDTQSWLLLSRVSQVASQYQSARHCLRAGFYYSLTYHTH